MHAADRCRAHCEDESHLGKIRGKGLDQPSRSSSSIAQFQRVRDVRGGGDIAMIGRRWDCCLISFD